MDLKYSLFGWNGPAINRGADYFPPRWADFEGLISCKWRVKAQKWGFLKAVFPQIGSVAGRKYVSDWFCGKQPSITPGNESGSMGIPNSMDENGRIWLIGSFSFLLDGPMHEVYK